mmetsp:Transcript_41865/g.48204  ORF Transcript_41865/g.48204 Transcript_41865/m.48204 type:complete len:197 (-) Transcript_41865:139-729(-)
MLAKYQMALIQSLKFTLLLGMIEDSDFYLLVFIVLFSDALGRIQLWRMLYRRFKAYATKKPVKRTIHSLAEVVLCSEFDMDYFPWILMVVMNILKSPVENVIYGLSHIKNSYLELAPQSMVNQTPTHLLTLLIIIIIGDIITVILDRILRFCRLYPVRYMFPQSTFLSCLYSPIIVISVLPPLLGLMTTLNFAEDT